MYAKKPMHLIQILKLELLLLLETGTVVCGNNQENAAYPSGLCAERIAFFSAGSNYPEQNIKQIAIVTQTNLKLNKTVMPCGACRQVMIEYEQKQGQLIEILLRVNDGNIFVSNSVQNILPFAFECLELKTLKITEFILNLRVLYPKINMAKKINKETYLKWYKKHAPLAKV